MFDALINATPSMRVIEVLAVLAWAAAAAALATNPKQLWRRVALGSGIATLLVGGSIYGYWTWNFYANVVPFSAPGNGLLDHAASLVRYQFFATLAGALPAFAAVFFTRPPASSRRATSQSQLAAG